MIPQLLSHFAADPTTCTNTSFLGFPTWYAYLPQNLDCSPRIVGINDIWLIVAAVVEILLRIAALAAIVIIIWGGVDFITSQGEPDKAAKARGQVINAVIGLAIAVSAAAIVTFIAGKFTS